MYLRQYILRDFVYFMIKYSENDEGFKKEYNFCLEEVECEENKTSLDK